MKAGFRASMAWLHTWAGLLLGWVLYFIFVTGTVGYLDSEIDRWMRPALPPAAAPAPQAAAAAQRWLHTHAPQAKSWSIRLPSHTRAASGMQVLWQGASGSGGGQAVLNSHTGEPIDTRATGGGQTLYKMHYQLHYLPALLGYWVVGIATMAMLVAIVSGIIIHKKIFKQFFTFRPGRGQRSWLDAHNLFGVIALPFHLMMTYSGLILLAAAYMPLVLTAAYGSGPQGRDAFMQAMYPDSHQVHPAGVPAPMAPLAPMVKIAEARWGTGEVRELEIDYPGDANARVTVIQRLHAPQRRHSARLVFDGATGELLSRHGGPSDSAARNVWYRLGGLHEGLFAGPTVRCLYLLSGLLGTVMVATGLVHWTAKRARDKRPPAARRGLALVERLNVGTLVGLPVGIAAYFWANRLIPVDLAGRADWEVHTMFIVWALMLGHAAIRPVARAWPEQFGIATAAFALLPLVNALTTARGLANSLPAGQWVYAGFDLTILAVGVAFAWMAYKARGQTAPSNRRLAMQKTEANYD